MSMCSLIFPKRFNSKAPSKATALKDCRPRAWHQALTTRSQVAAKDLVDQGRCLGLAIQPRDSSTGSQTVPARPPCAHPRVLSTNSWLELRAAHCGGNAASRDKGPGIQVLPGEHAEPTVPSAGQGTSERTAEKNRDSPSERGPMYLVQPLRQDFCIASMA